MLEKKEAPGVYFEHLGENRLYYKGTAQIFFYCIYISYHSAAQVLLDDNHLQERQQTGYILNSYSPEQNGRHFSDIFRCIFVNEKFCILIKISINFVPKGLIDNNSA